MIRFAVQRICSQMMSVVMYKFLHVQCLHTWAWKGSLNYRFLNVAHGLLVAIWRHCLWQWPATTWFDWQKFMLSS